MSKRKIDADLELTNAQLAAMVPLRDVYPELAAWSKKKLGRPVKPDRKQPLSIRFDPDLIETLRAIPEYQIKLNALVRKAVVRRSPVLFK